MLQDKENEQFKAVHPWQEFIESFLVNKNQTFKEEVFDALGIEPGRRESRHDRTIEQCLKILGWESTNERGYSSNGYRPRLWKRKSAEKNSNFYKGVDRNARNNDISGESLDPPFDPPLDPKNNNNCSSAVIAGVIPFDPPFDPPKNGVDQKNNEQLEDFDPPFDPPLDPDRGVDRMVDRKTSSQGKGFGHFDPPSHQKVKNKKEIKKEIIQPHPSFKRIRGRIKVSGITGEWMIVYQIKESHINIEFTSPEGQRGSQGEFIQITERLTYQQFKARVEGAIWELEKGICGDRVFRVQVWSRDVDELEPKWIEGCKLVSVPNPPASTNFLFVSPDCRSIPKFGIDEFELMEDA